MTATAIRTPGARALREIWEKDEIAVGALMALPGQIHAEVMSTLPWDSLFIDLQHGTITQADVIAMLPALLTKGITPIVRVPSRNSELIGPLLDAGVYGIVGPQIDTAADAEQFAAACRYPPLGNRSFGPLRTSLHAGPGYFERANDECLAIALIESTTALENLEAIVRTPGIDMVQIGPVDFSISAGRGTLGFRDPGTQEATRRLVEVARSNGIASALTALTEVDLEFHISLKPNLLQVTHDLALITSGATKALAAAYERLAAAGLISSERVERLQQGSPSGIPGPAGGPG